ncbi:hypothetical protein Z517_05383 [Fonsecaea pedrosoi CBS 271.37]|uniref:Uncharacterized protein n=1 Tax=Fonsecaea pedrosoi CBS 271.37 TaxID=1442368 RepID=A0A0D2DWZ7_9EURO|nr:uncharacterized protein Z517_05383 [Fonsecaea pedrosoi CBS 271.37]KIW82356.1 hypothetical protein Z517_05383 [Fonsecaea pedrosoi CBS 271.37]
MTKSINWPPLAQRALVEWIDDHKGPQGALIQNYTQALTELVKCLRTKFQDNASFSKGLLVSNVEQRIKYLWQYRLESCQSSAVETFFRDGIEALDWDKLHDKPVARAYTKDELASFKKKGNRSTTATTDYYESSNDERPRRADKRRRTKNGPEDQAHSTREQRADRRRKSPVNGSAKEPEPQNDQRQPNPNSRGVGSTTFGNNMPSAGRTHNMAPIQQDKLPGPGLRPNASTDLSTLPVLMRGEADSGDGPFFDMDAFDRDISTNTDDILQENLIVWAMSGIEARIKSIICYYFEASDIPQSQPIILDTKLQYPDECRAIIAAMLGIGLHDEANRQAETVVAFLQTQTDVGDFLKSFIGKAVTKWALQPAVYPRAWLAELGEGVVESVIKHSFVPELGEAVRRRLWNEHLNSKVIHTVESEAHHMGAMLLAYIDIVLRKEPLDKGTFWDPDVYGLPLREPRKELSRPSPRLQESLKMASIRRSLNDLFRDALEFQIHLTRRLHEDWIIWWPEFQEPYERAQHRKRKACDSDDEDDDAGDPNKQYRVCLGFIPLVQRRYLLKHCSDEWSSWKVMSRGVVKVLNRRRREQSA